MKQKLLSALLVVVASFAIIGVANCGSTSGYDLGELTDTSAVIVLGQVTRVKASGELDDVTVKVIDVLKGTMPASEFKLELTPRGLVGFDVALSDGDVGVFFLADAPPDGNRKATLTHHQSVALLSKTAFSVSD